MTITELVTLAHENSKAHGFWNGDYDVADLPLEQIATRLMLIVSEASEALEALRETGTSTWVAPPREDAILGKPMGFGSELADIVIRVADLAGALGIDLEEQIALKHEFNVTRSFKHGKAL